MDFYINSWINVTEIIVVREVAREVPREKNKEK